jgi:hypothetical protein
MGSTPVGKVEKLSVNHPLTVNFSSASLRTSRGFRSSAWRSVWILLAISENSFIWILTQLAFDVEGTFYFIDYNTSADISNLVFPAYAQPGFLPNSHGRPRLSLGRYILPWY